MGITFAEIVCVKDISTKRTRERERAREMKDRERENEREKEIQKQNGLRKSLRVRYRHKK